MKDSVQQIGDAVIWMQDLKEDMLKIKDELVKELGMVSYDIKSVCFQCMYIVSLS